LHRLCELCKPVISINELKLMSSTFDAMLTRLIESQEQLEQATNAKQQFLRFVFHEVRVPLNAVTLGIEQLKEGHSLNEEGLEILSILVCICHATCHIICVMYIFSVYIMKYAYRLTFHFNVLFSCKMCD
jgi:signal transduction histidine kinase